MWSVDSVAEVVCGPCDGVAVCDGVAETVA